MPAIKPDNWSWDGLIRSNILKLQPYRCARDDYDSGILLDANENALGHAITAKDHEIGFALEELNLNRYPDPSYDSIKSKFASLRGLQHGASGLFLGVGSDEAIDLLMRITCTPGKDSILVCPPTYGMYTVCATINDVNVVKIPLDVEEGRFQPQVEKICEQLSTLDPPPKLVFLTSPGNPTGTLIPSDVIRPILDHPTWRGLLVMDEAYIDFSDPEGGQQSTSVHLLNEGYQNLVVLQTLSKGFGLAGIRMGICMSDPALAQFMANTKAPYNIASPTASLALKALDSSSISLFRQNVNTALDNRAFLYSGLQSPKLQQLGIGKILGQQHANFLLVQILAKDLSAPDNVRSNKVYKELAENRGVVIRFRGNEIGCEGCVRITVGTRKECEAVLQKLEEVLTEL